MFNFVTLMIVVAGALNWFCIGVFQFDIIAGIFGTQSHFFSRFVYTVIGLAGFWILLVSLVKKGQLTLWKRKTKKHESTQVVEQVENHEPAQQSNSEIEHSSQLEPTKTAKGKSKSKQKTA